MTASERRSTAGSDDDGDGDDDGGGGRRGDVGVSRIIRRAGHFLRVVLCGGVLVERGNGVCVWR